MLIDYDNVRPPGHETSPDVVEQNLLVVVRSLTEWLAAHGELRSNEVELRFYGGWTSASAHFTQRGDWMLKRLSASRGLFSGIRVHPVLSLAIAESNACVLRGLCRTRNGQQEQKMVDSMICVDLMHYSRHLKGTIVTASDDDDLVPALLAASLRCALPLRLLRHRIASHGLNDHHLLASNIVIAELPLPLRKL